MKKLFVSDLDGTVLMQGETRIKRKLIDTIRNLDKQQCKFAVASGRSYGTLKKFFAPVGHQMYFICENGAFIQYQGKTIYKMGWNQSYLEQMIVAIQKLGYDWVAAGVHTIYTEAKCGKVLSFYRSEEHSIMKVQSVKEIPEAIVRISIYQKDGKAKERIGCEMDKLHIAEQFIIGYEDDTWLDLLPRETNKANALKWLCEYHDIDMATVVAFGDNDNDIEMLKFVPDSYAMGWARQSVKDAARYETNCVLETIMKYTQNK